MWAELSWRGRTGTVTVDGADIARVHRAGLRERAQAELSGACWTLASHRGVISATGPGGSPRHAAHGEGVWARRWTLDLGATSLRMVRSASGRWRLIDVATGEDAGVVHARGMLSPQIEAQLPGGTAPDAVVFVLWVADVRARRRAATVAGG